MAETSDNIRECPKGYQPNSIGSRCVKTAASISKTYTFHQLAAGYAVANDPDQVRRLLVSNNIVASMEAANSLSASQLESTIVNYYNQSGKVAFGSLMNQFTPIASANNWTTDPNILGPAYLDIIKVAPMQAQIATENQQFAVAGVFSNCAICNSVYKALVGGTQSQTAPVITQTTKASPVMIGLIAAGIAVLAIMAWVVIKYKN